MKNGPAASELRRDAHDCIMVPILTDRPNTRMRAIFAPDGELRSELSSFALTAAKLTRPTSAGRRARDRQGRVASRWPSATLDRHCARRPTTARSGRGDGTTWSNEEMKMIEDQP